MSDVEKTFLLSEEERKTLWRFTQERIESYFTEVPSLPVKRAPDLEAIRRDLSTFTFDEPMSPTEALGFIVEGLKKNQTHFAHPAYFGLFDPAGTPLGVAADAITAAFNPQLAASLQSVFPIETEQHLIRKIGEKFGYGTDTEGSFTSGGSEANHTALLVALCRRFPKFGKEGVRALPGQPTLYVSREAHHSFHKAARMSGLGDDSVRHVEIDEKLRMDVNDLREKIKADKKKGFIPFFVAATVGTTKAGTIDPLPEIESVTREEELWLHVDGAWGGAVCFSPTHRSVLKGIEKADSITLDAHKWMGAPMGAGMYLSRHRNLLNQAFALQVGYIPLPSWDVIEPFKSSIQWSRRFIGLKVFAMLATVGWKGYEALIDHHVELGHILKARLLQKEWEILNDTPLPVACFTPTDDKNDCDAIVRGVLASGKSWISTAHLSVRGGGTRPALRAAVVNYRTKAEDIDDLMEVLAR